MLAPRDVRIVRETIVNYFTAILAASHKVALEYPNAMLMLIR